MSKSARAAARPLERGQMVPLLAVVLALASAAAVVTAEVGVAAIERARAQQAADAAALAGAAVGPVAAAVDAEAVAAANGAELIGIVVDGATVTVEVRYRRAAAVATAEASGPAPGADGLAGGHRESLAPAMLAALSRADELLGRSVPVTSGYRSRAEQEALWNARHDNPYPVAPPGSSRHEAGLAIDVPLSFVPALLAVAASAGLCQRLGGVDPVHFETCPPNPP